MKNREVRIVVVITVIVVMICFYSQYTITKTKTSQIKENEISVFKTRNEQEYLDFLKNSCSKIEILGVTTMMDTYEYLESYVVTYKKHMQKEKSYDEEYEYLVFKTRDRQQFEEMYDKLNLDEVEIIDISVIQDTYARNSSYMITYRTKVFNTLKGGD